MVKIEELLMPDEKVVKQQGKIQAGNMPGMPVGDLYLTNKRLVFLHSKGWSLLTPTPGGAVMGKDIMISLQDVKSVKKGFAGTLKVQADKEYQFSVTVWNAQGWVNAVLQACALIPPPVGEQTSTSAQTPNPSQGKKSFCANCGTQLRSGDKFCSSCGAKVQ